MTEADWSPAGPCGRLVGAEHQQYHRTFTAGAETGQVNGPGEGLAPIGTRLPLNHDAHGRLLRVADHHRQITDVLGRLDIRIGLRAEADLSVLGYRDAEERTEQLESQPWPFPEQFQRKLVVFRRHV